MARYMIPLGIFIVLVVFLGIGLGLNPRDVPSPLIGKAAPEFSLPRLDAPQQTFGKTDLQGQVWLLNVWASWCVSCRAEHPVLNAWANGSDILMVGLNYKDEQPAARQWLGELGDPYTVSVIDADGRVGIDWGVYGVPETFVIDKKGHVRYKHTGPVTMEDVETKLMPLVQSLRSESS